MLEGLEKLYGPGFRTLESRRNYIETKLSGIEDEIVIESILRHPKFKATVTKPGEGQRL